MDHISTKINNLVCGIEANNFNNRHLKNRINRLFDKLKLKNNSSKIIRKMSKIDEIINEIETKDQDNINLLSSINRYSITRNAKEEFMQKVLLYNHNIIKAKIIYKERLLHSFPSFKIFNFNNDSSLDDFLKNLDFSYTEELDFLSPYNSQVLFGTILCENNIYYEREYYADYEIGFNWKQRQLPTLKSIDELIII